MGAEKQTKGRVGRRQRMQATRRFRNGTVSRQPKRQAPSLPGKKLRPTAAPRVGHRRRAERMRSQADNNPPENTVMLQAG